MAPAVWLIHRFPPALLQAASVASPLKTVNPSCVSAANRRSTTNASWSLEESGRLRAWPEIHAVNRRRHRDGETRLLGSLKI
ncbi:hypothetical protein AJ87_46885 [Rhizobium yanglingense]|nr:hypothetical protein AJ87_46885 [Rhizobium yanglingense]